MNNKQKNRALLVGFLLMLIVSYVFTIQKTVDLKSKLNALEKDAEMMSGATTKIVQLQHENKKLDSILKKNEVSIENSFQQILLKKLNEFSKNAALEIISFKQPHRYEHQGRIVMTYAFEVKGNFKSLLQLTNTIERQHLGVLVSLNFEKKRNYRKNKDELIGLFYIQKLNQLKE